MFEFSLPPTPAAAWADLVAEAKLSADHTLSDSVENYLVLTLDHFTQENTLATSIIAIEYLTALQSTGVQGPFQMRQVGDQCLLISGLFPERALRKQVSLDYFIEIGRQAYCTIANTTSLTPFDSELFLTLSKDFVGLLDILHHIRGMALNQYYL